MDYKEVYEQWIANPYFDESTKEELKSIERMKNEIKERFLYGSGVWYSWSSWNHWSWNQSYEHLCCQKSNTGACKLYRKK